MSNLICIITFLIVVVIIAYICFKRKEGLTTQQKIGLGVGAGGAVSANALMGLAKLGENAMYGEKIAAAQLAVNRAVTIGKDLNEIQPLRANLAALIGAQKAAPFVDKLRAGLSAVATKVRNFTPRW